VLVYLDEAEKESSRQQRAWCLLPGTAETQTAGHLKYMCKYVYKLYIMYKVLHSVQYTVLHCSLCIVVLHTEYTEFWHCPLFPCWLAYWQVEDPSVLLGHCSRECTQAYLSTGISNLPQPAQGEVVLGHFSTNLASWSYTLLYMYIVHV
jgi:hypothetical protein